VGVGLLAVAVAQGIGWEDAAIGLSAALAGLLLLMRLRGRMAPTLRMTGPAGHGLVLGGGVVFVALAPLAALLFAGSSLLLAATRGYAGCEILAVPNLLLRRNDEIACPVFSPIDALEAARRREVPRR
jgi:hypothetical protein